MKCEGELCKEDRKRERKQLSQHIASTVQGSVPLWAPAYQTDATLSILALLIELASLPVQIDRLLALLRSKLHCIFSSILASWEPFFLGELITQADV